MADATQRTAELLNARLIDTLLADGSIKSPRVEAAFRSVLRHHFLPGTPLEEVYSARAVVTRRGPDGMPTSSSSDPKIMARMLEQLDVRPGDRMLEIGAATGYNAALLSHLSGEAGAVTTVDIEPTLTATAVENLRRAGVQGVEVVTGDGWAGVPSHAPFDRIEATVGVWDLSPAWTDQLGPGGVLEVPLWLRAGLQASIAFEKTDDGLRSRSIEPCAFMRLQGLGAGPESYTRLGRWTAHLDHPRANDLAMLTDLLEQPPATHVRPPLDAGWFTAIALSAPDAVMLANWEEKVTLSGLFDSAGGSLAVIESDCSGSEPRPRALHAYGAAGALGRLTELIEETSPIGLEDVQIDVTPSDVMADDTGVLARLSRPDSQLLIRRINRL